MFVTALSRVDHQPGTTTVDWSGLIAIHFIRIWSQDSTKKLESQQTSCCFCSDWIDPSCPYIHYRTQSWWINCCTHWTSVEQHESTVHTKVVFTFSLCECSFHSAKTIFGFSRSIIRHSAIDTEKNTFRNSFYHTFIFYFCPFRFYNYLSFLINFILTASRKKVQDMK